MSEKKLIVVSLGIWAVSLIGAAAVAIKDSWALALVLAAISTQLLLVAALAKRSLTRTQKLRSYVKREAKRTRDQVKHYYRNSTVTHGLIGDAAAERILPYLPEKTSGPRIFTDSTQADGDSRPSWLPSHRQEHPGEGGDVVGSLQALFAEDPEVTISAGPNSVHPNTADVNHADGQVAR